MKAALKFRTRKLIRNGGGYAYTFSIVRNFRHPVTQVPTNETLAYLGSIRSSDIPAKSQLFHDKLDAALDSLKGQISEANAEAIKRRFQLILPKPKVTAASRIEVIRASLGI
jgi:hypothetical protein